MTRFQHTVFVFFTVICLSIPLAAQLSSAASYKLSMLPRYATEEINKRITPFAKYLSQETGLEISPTLTSTFDQYSKQLTTGGISIGFQNPYIYVLAAEAHEVVAMAVKGSDGDKFRGIIIIRNDSTISKVDDLKGKKIGIVGFTSAGGYLSQKLTLLKNEIDVEKDCSIEEAPEN
ncbi:MAG: PhnD/SsuA/transferrin family substrate-binding protein, partial [Desulfobulbaceae bacterium]|nr:PhnD/SsuA/transferrin family substrate-binding protein [Desulfobulbaceae bacterium]